MDAYIVFFTDEWKIHDSYRIIGAFSSDVQACLGIRDNMTKEIGKGILTVKEVYDLLDKGRFIVQKIPMDADIDESESIDINPVFQDLGWTGYGSCSNMFELQDNWKWNSQQKVVDLKFSSYDRKNYPEIQKYLKEKALGFWSDLGDIPIDDDECIEEPFLDFPVGTDRETIWDWFEETFDISVAEDLMHREKEDSSRPGM